MNFEELEFQLLSHPSFPSLHSITSVFDHFNIDNVALVVPKNKETIGLLPTFFLSTVSPGNEYVIVSKKDNGISLFFEEGGTKSLSIQEFLEVWSGYVVSIEKAAEEGYSDNSAQPLKRTLAQAVIVVLLLGVFFMLKPNGFQSAHFALSIIGLAISILIIKHELGYASPVIDQLCDGKKSTSCDDVLDSKGATILNLFKLSDIAVVYFLGLALTWITNLAFGFDTAVIEVLSVVALPFTFYSIYYQYAVVKKWCPLCLAIVTTLWFQSASLLLESSLFSEVGFSISNIAILVASFVTSAAIWMLLRPLLEAQKSLKELTMTHYKFKRNFELFQSALQKADRLQTSILEINGHEIVLGNKKAKLEIVLVTNPLCFYCRAAHADFETVLKNKAKDIKLTLRFNGGAEHKDSVVYKVTSRLLELYHTESEDRLATAMHEAFDDDADFDAWIDKWGGVHSSIYDGILEMEDRWCQENAVHFTPSVFINGYLFPKEYDRTDLTFFIDDLSEMIEKENRKQPLKINKPAAKYES
ncbi:vitamin K epoxide reductase family protein [Croceitalea marina]|uniref:Vitamin K epoxide reductase family protein n=1 Tax=Croceitalea marina TaxID=1775166 RepID=A0ABW5MW16_9FLAO